ncbi:glutaredoxin family protein [Candidatus Endolissoclinum faulkneri L5]|uniref:Glutaredoxin n=1 Tax=Candidatus Endolissoclinum faulkneri L5 TaxID=1401328 RepID=V9TTE7_9PROT|nr:Grx4 family monothiol glutaredoxin [Candidatus Endolissoclinum faulkneri]AHC73866.1 glutaredoxin family protein [Candidatus Endolissoclinum faulkneri L5]
MLDDCIKRKINEEIAKSDVLLFMKGTPAFPQCGFSSMVVQILSNLSVKFKGVNVLKDQMIREAIKEYSKWPTIPQLYVKGEFIGGCDIVREMFDSGELVELFNNCGIDAKSKQSIAAGDIV